jgi:hypothetical protein
MLFRVCVACDHTNPPDSRFCGKCGAPLQVRFCRLCRSANDAVSRYCRSCGTELPELSEPEAAPSATPRPATVPPLVIATPGRPIADAVPAAPAATTIASAFSGDEARGNANAGGSVAPIDGLGAQPVGRNGAQPAIEVLRPRPTTALVDSAITTVSLPAVIDDAPPARPRRAWLTALGVAIAVVGAAMGALAYHALRPGGANPPIDRAAVPAVAPPAVPAAPADTAAAAAADVPRAAPPAQPAAPPASASRDAAPRERRKAAPRANERGTVSPATASPALRECTAAVAVLGLCTPEPKPEGN